MTPEETYQQYLQWSQLDQSGPQDSPPEPAEAVNDELLYKPGGVPRVAEAAPKTIVRYYTNPGRARDVISGIGANLRGWLAKMSPADDPQMQALQMEEKVLALGDTERALTRIGEDTAQYEAFTRELANNGLRLNLNHMSFVKELSRKMRTELGEGWKGRVSPEDEDALLSAAALQVAVAHASIPQKNKDEYQSAVWSDIRARVKQNVPEYDASASVLRRELGEIESYLSGWEAPTEDRLAIVHQWYERITGQKSTKGSSELVPVLQTFADTLRRWHGQSSEAQKWARLGVPVNPDDVDPTQPEIPLTRAPFAHDSLANYAIALSRRMSWANPYAQAAANAHEDMRDLLGREPEKVLGPMWKFVDDEPVGAPVPSGAVSRRLAWEKADKDIRAIEDPAQRYEKLLDVLGSSTVNEAMRAHWDGEIDRRTKESVAQQRADFWELESRKDNWRADVHRAVENSSRAAQADRLLEQERAEKIMADSPLYHAITWTMNAAGKVGQALFKPVDDIVVSPISDVVMDHKYAGLAPAETQAIDKAGSMGQYLLRQLGTENAQANWLRYYSTKVSAGQAGWTDHAFFTGAMLTAGLLEMPGMMLDSPFEFAAIAKLLGGWHKGAGKVGEAMARAGVPSSIVAGAHLAANPLNPGRAVTTLLGRTPKVVRALGMGERRFLKELKNATPEYRQAARAHAENYFQNARAAGLLTDQNKADLALSTYASLLARMDEGKRVTPQDVRDFSAQLQEMSPAITRRTFAYFQRHGESYNALLNGLSAQAENLALFEQEENIIRLSDAEFQKNPIGITPTYLMKQAYQAFHEGKLDRWKERFSKGFGAMIPKSLADMWLSHIDKRIQVGASLPQHEAITWAAARELRAQEAKAKSMMSFLRFLSERADVELATSAGQKIATEANIEAARATGATDLLRQLEADLGELNGRRDMLRLIKDSTDTDWARLLKKRDVRMSYLNDGPEPQPKDFAAYQGLETGHRLDMNTPMKRQAARWLLELSLVAPEELGRHGFSAEIHTAATEAVRLWKSGEERVQKQNRALKLARAAAVKNDWAHAQKVLKGEGIMAKATEEGILEGLGRMTDRVDAAEKRLTDRITGSLHKKLTDNRAFEVPELNPDLTEAIQAVRRQVEDNASLLAGRPAATITDYLIDPMYVTAGRLSGIITQQGETGGRSIMALVERMRDDADTLSIAERKTLAQVQTLHPSEWPADLPGKISQLAQREWDTRSMIVDMARQVGAISDEEAGRLLSHGYADRYYVSSAYMKELVESGRTLTPETLSQTVRMGRAAPLQRFKAAASPHYARVFYMDWGADGAWKEKTFAVNEHTSPAQATKQAHAFIRDLVDKKKLGKGEYSDVVPALTDKLMAKRGMVDSNLDLRYDTLAHLATEVARRQMFTQFAKMTNLVRDHLGDNVPTNQSKQWVLVDGPEWGALSGRWVHKGLIKQINSWTGFSKVLQAITKDVQDSLVSMGHEDLVGKIKIDGVVGKVGNWIDTLARHNRIMWNIRSWANNSLGNITSAMFSGINPTRPRFWRYFMEYDQLRGNLSETEALAAIQRESGEPLGVEGEFMDTAWHGMWQTPVDMPEYMSQGMKGLKARERSEMHRLIEQVEDFEKAAERMELYLQNAKLSRVERQEYEQRGRTYREHASEKGEELLRRAVRNGTWEAIMQEGTPTPTRGAPATAVKELGRFFANPSASEVRRYVAEAYGAIDAKYKWAAYRSLRADGHSVESATEIVCRNFQNFAALHPFIRGLRDRKVLGAFVPGFPAEAARTGANMVANNPVPVINFFAGIAAWNFGALFAKGMAPSDLYQMGGDASTLDYLKRLFLTVHIPTSNGLTSLDLTQMGPWAAFIQPSGIAGRVLPYAEEWLDEKAGIFGLPVSLMANWASNFVLNTPVSGSLTRWGAGVDTFKGELVFHNRGVGEVLGNMLTEIRDYMGPAIFTNGLEGLAEHRRGPVSLITRFFPNIWERVTKGLSGQNIRQLDRKRAMAHILLKYGGQELAQKMYEEGLGADQKEYKAAVFRLQDARTDEEIATSFTEAKELLRKFSGQKGTIAGQKVEWEMNEDQLAAKVIRDASQNILRVIRQIPTDRAVQAARQLGAGIGRADDAEMIYLWRTLQDPDYLSSKDDVAQLMDALKLSITYAREVADPVLRNNFAKTEANLVRRLVYLRRNAITKKPVNLMKEKIDTWPRHMLEATIDRLGLR